MLVVVNKFEKFV